MRRRDFISLVGGAAAAWPLAAGAQQGGQIARVGFLGAAPGTPFLQFGLLALSRRTAKARIHRRPKSDRRKSACRRGSLQSLCRRGRIARSKVDVFVTFGPEISLKAAIAASQTTPIVMIAVNYDPIAGGYVSNIARPDRNITGLVYRAPELAAKQLELLVEAFPDDKPIAALWDSASAEQFKVRPTPCPIPARRAAFVQARKSAIRFRRGVPCHRAGWVAYAACLVRPIYSPHNVPISPIWRYSTACRRCSPSRHTSRRVG